MKVYLDDIREAPFGWDRVKTADECISRLETGKVVELSLDHDLAEEHYLEHFGYSSPPVEYREKTGQAVVDWMAENNVWPEVIILHTMNSAGRANMKRTIERYAPDDLQLEIRVGWKRE